MTSFISTLSLLILVLANGYFTLPVVDKLSSSTFSSLHDHLTTEHALNLQLVSDDEATVLPTLEIEQPSSEHMGFEMATSAHSLSEKKASGASRMFDEFFTTEQSLTDKHDYNDVSFTTVESIIHSSEHERRNVETETDTETDKREMDATLENETDKRDMQATFETEIDKREMQVELTTSRMPSFTSTSSAVAPELYTSQSSTSASTKKYTGFLQDEEEHEEEGEKPIKTLKKEPTKSKVQSEDKSEEDLKVKPKIQSEDKPEEDSKVKSPTKPKVQSEDQSEEDSKESSAPIAVFDQEGLKDISNVPSGIMILDETNDPIVTDHPDKSSKTTMENKQEEKPLNQGKESSHSKEKEPNN